MSAFDGLALAAINSTRFPVRKQSVVGGLRYHVHEYPHAAGGAFENLARKLYEIKMVCPFHATFGGYPNLWPTTLGSLRALFETGQALKLTIPTVGTIDARCVKWPEETDFKVRSGSEVTLEFVEDQTSLFLVNSLVRQDTAQFAIAKADLDDAISKSGINPSFFDLIQNTANDVLAYVDQVQLAGAILAAKVDGLAAILDEFDTSTKGLGDPRNYPLLEAFVGLWASVTNIRNDLLQRGGERLTYTVPVLMAISDVSTAIYGDSTHSVELLQGNPVDDAFAVPAGFAMKYYPDAA